MNKRLIEETIIRVGAILRKQDEFHHDIGAYGIYYLHPPSFSESAPSIKSFHSLDEFPWPEERCLILSHCDYGIRWKIGPQRGDLRVILDGACTNMREGPGGLLIRTNDIHFGGGHIALDRASRPMRPEEFDDSMAEEVRVSRFAHHPDVTDKLISSTVCRSAPRWEFVSDLSWLDTDRSQLARGDIGWLHAFTLAHLWHLSPLVSPTGYKVLARHAPFGPMWLRRSFAGKPIICIINYDRLYRMYESSKPREEGDVPRFMPLHHRRRHPRHLWRKAGLRLEDLPRDPTQRQLLVLERNVPRVMVKDCWVGSREFTLDGFDFEIEGDSE